MMCYWNMLRVSTIDTKNGNTLPTNYCAKTVCKKMEVIRIYGSRCCLLGLNAIKESGLIAENLSQIEGQVEK